MKRFKRIFSQLNKAVLGGISAFIFFVLGFLWWKYDANYSVPMWVVSIIIIACYLICIIIYAVCSSYQKSEVFRLPSIKSIQKYNSRIILIVEKNELYNQGAYTTICFQEDEKGVETVLGLGYVQSINSSGFMQIELDSQHINHDAIEIYQRLENSKYYRNSIKVRPSIYKDVLGEDLFNV